MDFSSRMFGDVGGIIVVVVQLAQSYLTLCNPMDCSMPGFLSYTSPRVCESSCSLSRWCHPTVTSSMFLSSSCPQSFPASGSFPMSWLFASGDQSIGVSASASVLPMSIQDWFPLGLTGLTSLQSKGLSRVFSNTTVQKHPFFGSQSSSWSNSHICTRLLDRKQLWLDRPLSEK